MDDIVIEPIGGFVGAGPSSHLKSQGRMPMSALSAQDRAKVEDIFAHPLGAPTNFYYRITRHTQSGTKSVNAAADAVPAALIASIQSELK
jgi:hypothetical protein